MPAIAGKADFSKRETPSTLAEGKSPDFTLFPENKNLSVCVYEKIVGFTPAESEKNVPPPLSPVEPTEFAEGVEGLFLLCLPACLHVGGAGPEAS